MTRILLLLPTATYRAPDFLDAARRMGVEVVVGSEQEQTLATFMGDRALAADLSRPAVAVEAIAALHARAPVEAVVAVDDQGALVASMASARLGLPHNPTEAVARTRNKAQMRRVLASGGVRQPTFAVLRPGHELPTFAFPWVVKAVPLSGSRGVIRADDPQAAREAIARVRSILAEAEEDPDGPVIVEQFVPGVEVAVEGLLRGGQLEILAIFDKPDPLDGPYFEETIYVTPSRLPERVQGDIGTTASHAAATLGLVEGPVHAELRVNDRGAWMLEIAARSIGGLCSRALRFGAGVSLEELILRHALSMPLDGLLRETAASGVMMLPIPRAGVLEGVEGREDAESVEGIVGLEITITPGRIVRPLPEGDRYLGFMFARADSPEQVEAALREAHRRLDVRIADATP